MGLRSTEVLCFTVTVTVDITEFFSNNRNFTVDIEQQLSLHALYRPPGFHYSYTKRYNRRQNSAVC